MLGLLDVVGPADALLGGAGTPTCQLDVGQGDQDHGHTGSRRQTNLRLIPLDVSQGEPVSIGRLIVPAPRRQQESEALACTSLERAQPAGKTLLGVIRHLAEACLRRVVMSLRGQGRSDPLQVARPDEFVGVLTHTGNTIPDMIKISVLTSHRLEIDLVAVGDVLLEFGQGLVVIALDEKRLPFK